MRPLLRVAERRGVAWYDDSKGTNVGASVTAVRGISETQVFLVATYIYSVSHGLAKP